eukprot:357985-Chlamydomonas_euryale.AAC.4
MELERYCMLPVAALIRREYSVTASLACCMLACTWRIWRDDDAEVQYRGSSVHPRLHLFPSAESTRKSSTRFVPGPLSRAYRETLSGGRQTVTSLKRHWRRQQQPQQQRWC